MSNPEKSKTFAPSVQRYMWALMAIWTLIVAASLAWSVEQHRHETREVARMQARTAHAKDLSFRHWNAEHGEVYVPVTEKTQPNPYLAHLPERDITTSTGKQLTLINPAYMTRLVHELEEQESNILGHITSLKPIRPENAADPWETEALQAFETGKKEVSLITEIGAETYMRLMRPLFTEEVCLKCHAAQGYKVGDIRGGISVAVPMEPLQAIAQQHILTLSLMHATLWIMGLVGISVGSRQIRRRITERMQAEDRLIESEQQLRSLAAHLASSREETMIAISRDLHDELGQILTGLKMDAAWLNGKITNEQQPLKEKVESIVGDLNDTIQVVKKITAQLRPVILDNQGLVPALRYEVQEFEKRTGIACSFTIEPPELTTDKDHSTAFYRIVQESLTNITKHAQASKVAISLKADQDQLVLQIQDNGIGITTEQTESLGAYGLLGMRERVLHLDGEIKIQGAQGQGTQLSVALPVRRKDRK